MEIHKVDLVGELNKLVILNNDRAEGYVKALIEVKDLELRMLFSKCAQQSRKFNSALYSEIFKILGKPQNGTTKFRNAYRIWKNFKSVLSRHDKKKILSTCEFGEDVAQDTYKQVMGDSNLPSSIFDIIETQYKEIVSTQDEIKNMRNSA